MQHSINLPTFSTINPEQILPTLLHHLTTNRAAIARLLQQDTPCWQTLMLPLEQLQDDLHNYWSLVSHLNAVVNSAALRAAYNQCLPHLSQYYTELSHNAALYQAICALQSSATYSHLSPPQKKVITNELRDFKLAGVALNSEEKQQFATLSAELTQLAAKFEENVLDATHHWQKHITDETLLAGIPPSARDQAKERAQAKQLTGWLFTLDAPSYLAVIMHADSRDLRAEIYRAYVTRASDQTENPQWDNSNIMQQILSKRLALAQLLGFNNYAEQSLATKMAKTPTEVLDFLHALAKASRPQAEQEFQQLTTFAKEHLHLKQLAAWDIAYCAEKLRQHRYDISQEALRPYFAEPNVLAGLFAIVKKLFQLDIQPLTNIDTWHPDVRCYAVYDQQQTLRSYFYFDLYARPHKRGGAWMDDCRIRRQCDNQQLQLPIAFVTCNFNQPTENQPALFSHDEVVTLFHEFGHALQHMLTTMDYAPISGINGIPWDAVELPSQFLENWAWQQEALQLFARHFQTGEPLPTELFTKLNNAKNFQSAMQMIRQLEFALFDFTLHLKFDPNQAGQLQTILMGIRQQVSVIPTPDFNRFQHSFSHIFAGGYAAGYYSYKWAEVMASDAFSLFLEKGIFDHATAQKFLENILEPGGSEEPAILFVRYRGHAPRIEALLQQSGIQEDAHAAR